MPSAKTEPAWVPARRSVKADKIATYLRTTGTTPDAVAHLTAKERRTIEAAAAVRRGSDQTWRLVVDMVAGSSGAPCTTCGIGYPSGVFGPRKPYGHDGPCTEADNVGGRA